MKDRGTWKDGTSPEGSEQGTLCAGEPTNMLYDLGNAPVPRAPVTYTPRVPVARVHARETSLL